MKRICRLLLALTSPLFLAPVCELSIAQRSQDNHSSQLFASVFDASALPADDFRLQTASRLTSQPEHGDGSPIDSTTLRTGASISPVVYYFFEPFPMEPGSSILQLGASFSLLAYPDVEQEVPIPTLDMQYKRGIFDNVAVVGSFSTCIFSNLFHGGIQWNTRLDRFSCGLANHLGFVYGFMTKVNRFDHVEGYALFDMSILRLGYRFDDFSCSCSFGITYVMKSRSYVNGLEASAGPQRTVNDFFCTLAVEQPFLKSVHLSIGLSLGYTRTPYQSWMLYNTIDEWLFAPEFFFAVQL